MQKLAVHGEKRNRWRRRKIVIFVALAINQQHKTQHKNSVIHAKVPSQIKTT